ncbi:MAG: hypothetical protein Q8L52_01550 [bacterium]|nr:hypothetical protein [bacterium]
MPKSAKLDDELLREIEQTSGYVCGMLRDKRCGRSNPSDTAVKTQLVELQDLLSRALK